MRVRITRWRKGRGENPSAVVTPASTRLPWPSEDVEKPVLEALVDLGLGDEVVDPLVTFHLLFKQRVEISSTVKDTHDGDSGLLHGVEH